MVWLALPEVIAWTSVGILAAGAAMEGLGPLWLSNCLYVFAGCCLGVVATRVRRAREKDAEVLREIQSWRHLARLYDDKEAFGGWRKHE
jgi:hypothetical protein